MRAPHPDFRELYRQAATPGAFLERDRRDAELIGHFEVDLDAAGMSGEALLAPLTDPVLLDAPLEPALARLDETGSPPEGVYLRPRRPGPRSAGGGEADHGEARGGSDWPQRAMLRHAVRAEPPVQSAVAAALSDAPPPGTGVAPGPAATPAVKPPPRVSDSSAARHAAASAERAGAWLRKLAERAGDPDALHRIVEIGAAGDIERWFARLPRAAAPGAMPQGDVTSQQPPAEIETTIHARLTRVLARIDGRAPPARQPASGEPSPQIDRLSVSADADKGPGVGLAGYARSIRQSRPVAIRNSAAPPPAAASRSPAILSAPTGGLRGLAELGRAMGAGADRRADRRERTPLSPDAPGVGSAGIDADQLADLLRREAERSGIDLAGLEP